MKKTESALTGTAKKLLLLCTMVALLLGLTGGYFLPKITQSKSLKSEYGSISEETILNAQKKSMLSQQGTYFFAFFNEFLYDVYLNNKDINKKEIEKQAKQQVDSAKQQGTTDKEQLKTIEKSAISSATLNELMKTYIVSESKMLNKMFKQKNQIYVSQLFFTAGSAGSPNGATSTPTEADYATAKKEADAAYARLKKGDKFDTVLKDVQQTPTGAQSGNIGWTDPERMSKDASKQLSSLKVGKYSEPIKVDGGYIIAYMKKDASKLTKNELYDSINDQTKNQPTSVLTDVSNSGFIKYVVKEYDVKFKSSELEKDYKAFIKSLEDQEAAQQQQQQQPQAVPAQ